MLECATKCSGIEGLIGGQFVDMFPKTPSLETIKDLFHKKTVTGFEVAFFYGWAFVGGGDIDKLPLIKRISYHFGMAFQIGDDLDDVKQDKREINVVHLLGKEKALELFEIEMNACLSTS